MQRQWSNQYSYSLAFHHTYPRHKAPDSLSPSFLLPFVRRRRSSSLTDSGHSASSSVIAVHSDGGSEEATHFHHMGQPGSVGSLLGQEGEEEARLSGELVWAQQSLLVLLVETLTLFVFSVVFYRYLRPINLPRSACSIVYRRIAAPKSGRCLYLSITYHAYV